MKIRSTWYHAQLKDGRKVTISCCPDFGTVSLAWNRAYQNLNNWTEKGLKDLLESTFDSEVTSLVAA